MTTQLSSLLTSSPYITETSTNNLSNKTLLSPTITTPSISSPTISGNASLTTNGAKILGNFSDATHSNRAMFQTTTTNGNTIVGIVPNGTGTVSQINHYGNAADVGNSSVLATLVLNGDSCRIVSTATGSGTLLPLQLWTNGLSRLAIDTSGRVTKPYQPMFKARQTTGGQASPNTVIFETADTNIGSHYNTTNGRFTAPVAGVYAFHWHQLLPYANSGEYRFYFILNGASAIPGSMYIYQKAANTWQTANMDIIAYLNANDYVTVYYGQGSGNTYADGNYNAFTGYLLG